MAKFKVDYHIDEAAFSASLTRAMKENEHQFSDELASVVQKAASKVIYGNFMGQGKYNPRAIGEFTARRARYYRGWVSQNYGSQRRYLEGAKRKRNKEQSERFDYLRNVTLLDVVSRHAESNPSLQHVLSETKRAKLSNTDPLSPTAGEGFHNLRNYLSSGQGKKLTRQAKKQADQEAGPREKVVPQAGTMKYGVQTGKLARAWRDLSVVSTDPRQLRVNLRPTMGSTTGTPDALKLTDYLSKNRGWRGLMDHDQLVAALEDQGVIIVND